MVLFRSIDAAFFIDNPLTEDLFQLSDDIWMAHHISGDRICVDYFGSVTSEHRRHSRFTGPDATRQSNPH